jgi:hypothetical protein
LSTEDPGTVEFRQYRDTELFAVKIALFVSW